MMFNLFNIIPAYQRGINTVKLNVKNRGCRQKVYPYEISVHGKRECERRKRQIARGQLNYSNGLRHD